MILDQGGSQFDPAMYENSGQALSMSEYFDAKDKWSKDLFESVYGSRPSGYLARPDYSLSGRIGSFFTGQNAYLEDEYNNYLAENQRRYETSKIDSARQWEEYMDSTKYQRQKADLEKAGYNPYMLVQQGLGSSTVSPGSTSYGTSARKLESKKDDKVGSTLSGIVTTALKLAMLAIVAS